MHRLRFFPRALINWLRGATLEQQMRDEFAFHLESRAADLVRQRLSSEAARRQARLEFGSVESYKELARAAAPPAPARGSSCATWAMAGGGCAEARRWC